MNEEQVKKSTHRVEVVPVILEPHENADSLSLVHVYGYTCVVKTEDWKNISLAAYILPDSVVDISRPEFSFLDKPRITVRKFRGIFSQGLLVLGPEGSKLGDDVSDILGVTRYEPPEPLSFGGENVRAPVGVMIPKYDVESWNRYKHIFSPDDEVVVTEKIHGANARFTFHNGEMFAGSHTAWKKEDPNNLWWKAMDQNPWIGTFCRAYPNYVLYSEVFGQVQDLKYGAQKNQIFCRAFDIWDKVEARWLDWNEIEHVYGPNIWVPVLYIGRYDESILVPLADGPSTIPGANNTREGIVIGTLKEQYNNETGRKKLKIVSNQYLERSK